MTTQNNSIHTRKIKNKFFISHSNRLLIVALSIAGLFIKDRQISNILFSTSIVLWLWEPEIAVFENKLMARINLKHFLTTLMVVFMVVMAYVSLKLLPEPLAWVFSIPVFIAVLSLILRPIQWLVTHNPIRNIGNEGRVPHRCFMVDHKTHHWGGMK